MTQTQAIIIQFCVVFATATWTLVLFGILRLLEEIRDILKKQKDSE